MLHQHLSAEPRRPSTVPDPLWTVIERCLRKNPDQRPSAENLARALRVVADGIGVHANSAAIAAAEGVGALLGPDLDPAPVPGTPGAADPTQVLPHTAGGYGQNAPHDPTFPNGIDPNGATSVLPHTPGAADPTAVLPQTGAADPTAVLPPVPPGGPGQGDAGDPDQPHPWQSQLRAARDRNDQTQVQYLDPNEDPLRRRPQRQVARPQQQPRRQQPPQDGYGYPQQQQPGQQRYAPSGPRSAAGRPRSRSSTPRRPSRSVTPRSPGGPPRSASRGRRGSAAPTR